MSLDREAVSSMDFQEYLNVLETHYNNLGSESGRHQLPPQRSAAQLQQPNQFQMQPMPMQQNYHPQHQSLEVPNEAQSFLQQPSGANSRHLSAARSSSLEQPRTKRKLKTLETQPNYEYEQQASGMGAPLINHTKNVGKPPRKKNPKSNHYIAPTHSTLNKQVRDPGSAALAVFERNLKKRNRVIESNRKSVDDLERQERQERKKSKKKEKDFITHNMAMPVQRRKITQGSKDVDTFQYKDYNRYADPHLKKYFTRKKIIENSKDRVKLARGFYFSGNNNLRISTAQRKATKKAKNIDDSDTTVYKDSRVTSAMSRKSNPVNQSVIVKRFKPLNESFENSQFTGPNYTPDRRSLSSMERPGGYSTQQQKMVPEQPRPQFFAEDVRPQMESPIVNLELPQVTSLQQQPKSPQYDQISQLLNRVRQDYNIVQKQTALSHAPSQSSFQSPAKIQKKDNKLSPRDSRISQALSSKQESRLDPLQKLTKDIEKPAQKRVQRRCAIALDQSETRPYIEMKLEKLGDHHGQPDQDVETYRSNSHKRVSKLRAALQPQRVQEMAHNSANDKFVENSFDTAKEVTTKTFDGPNGLTIDQVNRESAAYLASLKSMIGDYVYQRTPDTEELPGQHSKVVDY